MNEKMPDWSDLALFMAVAREGGLSPAARTTGRSPATLGRRMRALERDLGRDLFVRHERGYELTGAARELLADLRDVEGRILRLAMAGGEVACPLVRISAGTWTTLVLTSQLPAILGTPPDVRVRLISAEERLSLVRREAVIGVRNARPDEEGLAGRRLSHVTYAAYARADAPDRWIKLVAATPSARWLDRKIGQDAPIEVTHPRAGLDLALEGQGRALLPTFIGDRHAALSRVSETVPDLAHDQWLVVHQDDRHLPEVRRVIDRVCAVLLGGV